MWCGFPYELIILLITPSFNNSFLGGRTYGICDHPPTAKTKLGEVERLSGRIFILMPVYLTRDPAAPVTAHLPESWVNHARVTHFKINSLWLFSSLSCFRYIIESQLAMRGKVIFQKTCQEQLFVSSFPICIFLQICQHVWNQDVKLIPRFNVIMISP